MFALESDSSSYNVELCWTHRRSTSTSHSCLGKPYEFIDRRRSPDVLRQRHVVYLDAAMQDYSYRKPSETSTYATLWFDELQAHRRFRTICCIAQACKKIKCNISKASRLLESSLPTNDRHRSTTGYRATNVPHPSADRAISSGIELDEKTHLIFGMDGE